MSLNQKEDFNGRIAYRIKLADEKGLSTNQMISIISKGDEGIRDYFSQKKKEPILKHESVLSDFQL